MNAPIQVDDRTVIEAFNRLLALGTDPKPWLTTIGRDLEATTRLRFRDGRDPRGASWAPLSPVTIALRRKGGRGAKPLLDTGRLANSITSAVGENYVEVGTNVIYARMQQQGAAKGAFGRTKRGAPIPWGTVPGRAFLGLSIEDRAGALEVFAEAVERVAA
jgi:phage virion morphogenesis protein